MTCGKCQIVYKLFVTKEEKDGLVQCIYIMYSFISEEDSHVHKHPYEGIVNNFINWWSFKNIIITMYAGNFLEKYTLIICILVSCYSN